jgi:hypothetical protein
MNQPHFQTAQTDVVSLCTTYLAAEESLLEEALRLVHAVRARFGQNKGPIRTEMKEEFQKLANLVDDMKVRRRRFRMVLARWLQCDADDVTLSRVLTMLGPRQREAIEPAAERVRNMIGELVTINYRLAVHLRIHLDAYQRLLCDLTGTANSSGRYGREGKTETGDFRPVIQIQG